MSSANSPAKHKNRMARGGESATSASGFASCASPDGSAPSLLNPPTSMFQSKTFSVSQPALPLFGTTTPAPYVFSSAPLANQGNASAPNAGPKSLFDRPVSCSNPIGSPSSEPLHENLVAPFFFAPIVVENSSTPCSKSSFNSISAMESCRMWSFEELRFQNHCRLHPVLVGVETPASSTNDSLGTFESLSRFPAQKIFEKRKLTPDTTITFDTQALCQWLEKHHNFESTIITLLDLGTVRQKAAVVPDESNPRTESVNVLKPSTSMTEPATQPAPSRNTTEPAAEPAPGTNTAEPPAEPAPSVMTNDSGRNEVGQTSTSTDPASEAKNPYEVQMTDPSERRKRFNNLPTGLIHFSPGIWDGALRVLVKESPFMVDVLKDARFEVEQQFALRFQDLMQTASNTPRFVKGVKRFTAQVTALLDEIFSKLVTMAEDQKMQIDEEI